MLLPGGKPFVSIKPFQVIEILDGPACGPLSLVQLKPTKQNYHLQTVSKKFLYTTNCQDRFRENLISITKLSHPNLVTVHAWLEDLENVYLLIEYFEEEKKLSAALARNRFGSMYLESPTICAIKQLLGVVRYLHSHSPPIFHGTISAQKIFDAKNLPRLGGLALSGVGLGDGCEYAAPEQLDLKERGASPGLDIWALGIVAYKIMSKGKHPFDASQETHGTYGVQFADSIRNNKI